MKRKELLRRLSAVSMAAMMTVTAVPVESFAADIEFTDDEQETTEADVDLADTEEEPQADVEESQIEEDTQESAGDFGAADVFSDGEDAADFQDEAGETTPAADATVHMTISVAGVLADAKDGTAMAERDVTVKDLDGNGILTYDEALSAAHDEYYEGGAAAGYASADSQYGLGLTKLWGNTSGAFGYWVNDTSCSNLSEVVKADDDLTAFVYKDQKEWSDSYTKFGQKEYQATAGKAFTVSVDKASYDANYNVVFAAYDGAKLTAYDSEYKPLAADAYSVDGYNVTFNQAGTYYLTTAGNDEVNLVPAVAKVTVGASEDVEQKQYLEYIQLGDETIPVVQGQYSYDYVLPANETTIDIGVGITENVPENSTATLNYYSYNSDKDSQRNITKYNKDTKATIFGIASKSFQPITFTIVVGNDTDTQTYTVNATRSAAIDVTMKTSNGNSLNEVEGTYYIDDTEGDSINLTVNGYGAALSVDGTPIEDGKEIPYTLKFDEKNECRINITASNGENNSLSKEYVVKRITPEDTITGTCGEGVTWTLKNGVLTISGKGTIPQSITPSWTGLKKSITSVIVEEGITEIGGGTFNSSYTALKSVVIPKGMTGCESMFSNCSSLETAIVGSLGESMFSECSNLKNVTIEPSVTKIPKRAFSYAEALESITIPEGVTEIEMYAFQYCTSLKEVNLPSTLNTISGYNFRGCSALEKVNISGDKFAVKDNIIYTPDMKTLLFCPPAHEGKVEVTATVTEIVDSAFFYCEKVTEVTLPEGLTKIGDEAFSGCTSLNNVVIPESVTYIGRYAFQQCKAMTDIKLPSTLNEVSGYMLSSCSSLKKITIPGSVTSIGERAFMGCSSLESITLPETVTSIGDWAFADCSALKEFRIPENTTSIPADLFIRCKNLETVYIPAGVTKIGDNAFAVTTNCLKYVVYAGTPEQWEAIEGGSSKPQSPSWKNLLILYGCSNIGDSKNAPVIKEQPEEKAFALNEDATDALKVKAEELKDNEKYYITWFKNSQNATTGSTPVAGTMTSDGLGSTLTPATDTRETNFYYCVVEKVDASGAATWTYSDAAIVAVAADLFSKGSGTEKNPYELATADDLVKLKQLVKDGNSMANTYFKLTDDITLPEGWTPIGETIDGTNDIKKGKNLHAFSGILDGNGKTITVPEEGLPLIGYVQNAEVRNLNIYGKKIAGYGLVNNLEGVGLSGSAVVLDNITLKSGSSTLKSGLIGANITTNGFAGCSAGFTTTIRNCTIENDVVVGYDRDQSMIGSIAGRMQGTVENCVSYATVYGVNYVGGIIGTRDNAMGSCSVNGCEFNGTVEASGQHAGGIVGGGYQNSTAPNGVKVTINNCKAGGNVIGSDKVGGILGGDTFVAQAWNAYTMKGNSFTGKVQATGENASYIGGIIGFYDSLNKFDDITNNYYAKDCGAAKGIGFVQYVDTNCATHETASGATYLNSENGTEGFPSVAGCNWKAQHNRTDDPLGADASKLANTDGVKLYAEKLELSGDYRTEFYQGEDLDLTGMTIKAQMSDGTTKDLAVSDLTIEGYDKDGHGEQTLTLSYSGASVQLVVTVLKKDAEDIKVHFMLLGDKIHNSTEDKTYHTLRAGNLETWIADSEYEVGGNATVLDVFEEVMTGNGYTWENAKGNYISSITKPDGTKLGEFTNGQNSGWMYTLNGIHSDLSVTQQYLEDGDTIVFHYTDDYSMEHDHIWSSKWTSDKDAHWHECTYQYSKCDITDNTKKNGYGAHTFDEGKVTKKATYTETGVKTYTCTVCGYEKTETIPVVKHTHKYVWKTISKATIYQPQKQRGTCSLCGKTTTRNYGSKLKATIKLNVSSITLQKKQATRRVRVTMANGDSVKSWTSSNKKIVTVDRNGLIRAQNRTGSAKITVTLKSGKRAVLNVKVQAAKVRTTKISGLKSSMTIKKGQRVTLKPVISPLTSTEKVTYASSNKNIAVVSSKGVVLGKKKGTAKITVRSGKKSYVIKVTVK